MIEIIILSIIQGITEFIPVSSSLHLVIFSEMFYKTSLNNLNLLVFTSMHLGSLIAVILFIFYDSKLEIIKVPFKRLIELMFFGTLPSVLVGFYFYDFVSENLTINNLIIFSTFFFGVLLFFADRFAQNTKNIKHLKFIDLLFIGVFQCFSLIPGASRSATTIISSRFLGIDRKNSIIISTLLSFPVITGAFVLTIYKSDIQQFNYIPLAQQVIPSIFFSFISSYIALKIFFKYSSINGFKSFAIYRVLLALFLLFK
tara:strand:+ start:126 stop:896 length:771 start_codon:yes stop_codon:yes gene_type:complete